MAAAAMVALVGAACGDDTDVGDAADVSDDDTEMLDDTEMRDDGRSDPGPYGAPVAPEPDDEADEAAPVAPGDDGATVILAETEHGPVLTDAAGRTLYIFTNDPPGESTCTGDCLELWPRYAPDEVVAGEGVDGALLGTIEVDGVRQATIDKMPLYYFAGDGAPGDADGQGVGGVWFVVQGDGTVVR